MNTKFIMLFLIFINMIAFANAETVQQQNKDQETFYEKIHTLKFWEATKGTNPSPDDIVQKVGILSVQLKIPALIIESVMYQESSWRQFDSSGNPLISSDNGIGLMQVTVPDLNAENWTTTLGTITSGSCGDNPFTITTEQVSIDVNRLKTDWQYNLEIGCRILLTKKVDCEGAGSDATLLENWYYTLAYYNGFSAGGANDPANPIYSRTVDINTDWLSINKFPYQECIFNIIAQLYQLPSELVTYFGDQIKVTLPGPSSVNTGAGHYDYVDPNFQGGDYITFYEDNRTVVNGVEYTDIEVHQVNFGIEDNLPSEILSPVFGKLEVVNSLEECSGTIWCFNQHKTGGHSAGGGICQSNDTYAWDVNLNYPEFDSDNRKPLYSVADGIVTQTYGGCINAGGSYGQLLIEHNYEDSKWWSGYLHLRDIKVTQGDSVDQNTLLGYISNTSLDPIPNHLHFVVYEGENSTGNLISFNANIIPRYGDFSPNIINVPLEQPTIQAGIDAANNGDTVLVQPGIYVENINYNVKNITVGSLFLITGDTTYISKTIIDGNRNGSVVTFESGEDSLAVLCGFTITNGSAYDGGGIYCDSSSPSLVNVTITGNSADENGGGISCNYNSSPSLINIIISDNSTSYRGGGISCRNNSNPSLENVTIIENSAAGEYWGNIGGGIYCYESSPSLVNSTISGNSAIGDYSDGGGIVCGGNSSPSLENCTITGNYAGHYCGGIYCRNNSNPSLTNVTIIDNYSDYCVGGIFCRENSSPSFVNVIITGNFASTTGGGIYCWSSSPSFTNVTITDNSAFKAGGILCYSNSSPSLVNVIISDNSASYRGGGIYCNGSSPSLVNVTITENSASNGGGIYCRENSNPTIINSIFAYNTNYGIYVDSGDPIITYSNFYDNEIGNFYNCGDSIGLNSTKNANGDVCDVFYNIQLAPCFADTANGDYHLQENSPCIDAGTYFYTYEGDTLINLSQDEYFGSAPDMGAYEYGMDVEIENEKREKIIPQKFTLYQNYPNPFNPVTTIRYELPKKSNVKISIYDLRGTLIKTLVNQEMQPGFHKIQWNASDLGSGVYIYQIEAGDPSSSSPKGQAGQVFSEVKKCVLIK